MFALDTNTLIYFFKGLGQVSNHLLSTSPSEIAIPSIVLFELELGIEKSSSPQKRRGQLDRLLECAAVLPLGAAEAKSAARVRARLEGRGTPIGPLDTLIAGVALHNSATLVTHNVAEFGRVEGLAVVDWY